MIKVILPLTAGDTAEASSKHFTFSGGEEHVNITKLEDVKTYEPISIQAQITSSSEVMQLLLITDAIKRLYPNNIELFMPYLPYARQDRPCQSGDAFSLEVFANLINLQGYTKVTVVDAHSPVAHSAIHRLVEVPQDHVVPYVVSRLLDIKYIVSPDIGASRKAKDWLYRWNYLGGHAEIAMAKKARNAVGEITHTEVDHDNFKGGDCLIVDDICDGGRTFLELTKVLKEKNAGKVYLYVTHGIISKGVEAVGVEKILTTDTWPEKDDGRIIVKRFFYN